MYYCRRYAITKGHTLYEWCEWATHAHTNIYNSALFYARNLHTLQYKNPRDYHPLEQEVLDDVEWGVIIANQASVESQEKKNAKLIAGGEPPNEVNCHTYHMPTQYDVQIGSTTLTSVFRAIKQPDFIEAGSNLGTRAIEQVYDNFKSYYEARAAYNENPSRFLGEPKLPRYLRKQSASTAIFSNDGVKIRQVKQFRKHADKPVHYGLSLPHAPGNWLDIGTEMLPGRVCEVQVIPQNGRFVIMLVMSDGMTLDEVERESKRIAAIDIGVENLAAVVNNCGLPCMIFKGTPIKAVNQEYNKQKAQAQSEQTRGDENGFELVGDIASLSNYRHDYIRDFMLKTSKRIVEWCVDNRIDTLVVGHSDGWKQEANIGKCNNQNFVSIPFNSFISMLEWRCRREGVKFIKREESYTSKASFLSRDSMSIYGEEKDECPKFSGYRGVSVRYYRFDENDELESYVSRARGLFRDVVLDMVVNSDLNGAANILRKEFPFAFCGRGACIPRFDDVLVFSHPDELLDKRNRRVQRSASVFRGDSKSKQRRARRKAFSVSSSPSGVELCE